MTGDTDLTVGERADLTAEFVSRRVLDCEAGLVRRLLFADGERPVLVSPGATHPVGLRVGERYRLRGVLGCAPVPEPVGRRCPDCDGQLRPGGTIDTVHPAVREAVAALGPDGAFGVLDESARLRSVGAEDEQPLRPAPADRSPPGFVCTGCGAVATPEVCDR